MKAALLSFAALAVTALALQLPAKAQDSTSTSSSGSSSTSNSASGSFSGSRSGASTTSGTSGNTQQQRTNQRLNSTTNNTIPITLNTGGTGSGGGGAGTNGTNATDPAGANGANGSNGGGSGGSTTGPPGGAPFYSQSDVTVRTTPTVYAPPVSGGNPCTLAVSGGVSVIGWGAAAGGTFVDQDCADRQAIAMVHNAGYAPEAREMMCNNKAFYMAARTVGKPCAARPQFDGPGAPQPTIVRQEPQQLAPPPQQQVIKDRSNLPRCSRTITDNCFAG